MILCAINACSTAPSTCDHPREKVRKALLSAELRAASYLRAYSFGTYSLDRSEYARRSHLQMTADDAWQQMEDGLAKSAGGGSPSFFPIIACREELDLHTSVVDNMISQGVHINVPTESGCEYVVGTLDVTIGLKLPAEELIGKKPVDAGNERAYLSNVCVLSALRRQGIAQRLIEHACGYAGELGVKHMYVHVVEENAAARKLYERTCGFGVEQIENASVARALNRPRRMLLHKELHV